MQTLRKNVSQFLEWILVLTLPLWLLAICIATCILIALAWVTGLTWLLISKVSSSLMRSNSSSACTQPNWLGMYTKP